MKEDVQGQRGKYASLKADVRIEAYNQRHLLLMHKLMDSGKAHWLVAYVYMIVCTNTNNITNYK